MDPEQPDPLPGRRQDCRDRTGDAVFRRLFAAELADEAFAGDAQQDRAAESCVEVEAAEDFQIMPDRLAEPNAGIDSDSAISSIGCSTAARAISISLFGVAMILSS